MKIYPKSHVHPRLPARGTDDVDMLLNRFFKAALPDPWPACPRPVPEIAPAPEARKVALARFFRIPIRVAVAAAVAGFVIGYLALQSGFPEPKPSPSQVDSSQPMGFRPLLPGRAADRGERGNLPGFQVQPTPNPTKVPKR